MLVRAERPSVGVERATLASYRRSADHPVRTGTARRKGYDGNYDATFSGRPSARSQSAYDSLAAAVQQYDLQQQQQQQPCLRATSARELHRATTSRWAGADLAVQRKSSVGALRASSTCAAAREAVANAGRLVARSAVGTGSGGSARNGPRQPLSHERHNRAILSASTTRSKPVPPKAIQVLGRDSASAAVEGELTGAQAQVMAVVRSVEAELAELNLQYKRAVAQLRAPQASGEEEQVHARLRDLVLQMEQKSAQLAALRRTHTVMTDHLSGVRDELLATRAALEEAAETAAARFHRIRQLELEQQRAGTGY
jgi:hypothetical protein